MGVQIHVSMWIRKVTNLLEFLPFVTFAVNIMPRLGWDSQVSSLTGGLKRGKQFERMVKKCFDSLVILICWLLWKNTSIERLITPC